MANFSWTTNGALKVVTLNCRGLHSSMHDVQSLCAEYHFILLQETWLAKQQLECLSKISKNHYACGTAEVDYSEGNISGRPHGGTAILWHKSIPARSFKNHDHSIVGLRLCLDSSPLFLINVYLPYCCSANTDLYIDYLSRLTNMSSDLDSPNICFMGDFNACPSNAFGPLLTSLFGKCSFRT